MPRLGQRNLNHRAVLWEPAGFDNYGEPRLKAPVEIKCRWEQDRRESINAEGTPIAIDATVMVAREILPDSIMRLGSLEDLPDPVDSLMKVVGYSANPDIKSRVIVRDVSLQRYTGRLPATVATDQDGD